MGLNCFLDFLEFGQYTSDKEPKNEMIIQMKDAIRTAEYNKINQKETLWNKLIRHIHRIK